MKQRIVVPAIVALLFAVPAWGKDKPPQFGAIEITRFSKQQGVELTQDFLDYLSEALFNTPELRKLFAKAIVENEVVSRSQAPHTLTLRGVILEYGKGSHAKSLIGFGIGRRSLVAQITLFRRMDNAALFETQLKVRSQKTLNEKLLAVHMAKEVGNTIKDETAKIRTALLEADRRYVPPPAEAPVRATVKPEPAVPGPVTTPTDGQQKGGVNPSPAPQPAASEAPAAAPAVSPAPEPATELGAVEVSSNVEGAEVYVDDSFVGNAPARIKLSPGKHRVRVVMADQEDWIRELSVLPGSELKVYAPHTPKAPPPTSPAPAPDPKALSKQDILGLLTNFVPNARIATLVEQHGIRFKPTPVDLNEIEDAGGDVNLLNAIRKAAAPTDQ